MSFDNWDIIIERNGGRSTAPFHAPALKNISKENFLQSDGKTASVFKIPLPPLSQFDEVKSKIIHFILHETFIRYTCDLPPYNFNKIEDKNDKRTIVRAFRENLGEANEHIRATLNEKYKGLNLPPKLQIIGYVGGNEIGIKTSELAKLKKRIDEEDRNIQQASEAAFADILSLAKASYFERSPNRIAEPIAEKAETVTKLTEEPYQKLHEERKQKKEPRVPTDFTGYRQAIRNIPSLLPEEERELAIRWRDNNDLEAMHKLVSSHLKLVLKIASKNYKYLRLPLDESIAAGQVGLMMAVTNKGFNPDKRRLASYAYKRIYGSMLIHSRRSQSLFNLATTHDQLKLFWNLESEKKNVGVSNGGKLSAEDIKQISLALKVKPEDVIEMDRRLRGAEISLNAPIGNSGYGAVVGDSLADMSDSAETILADSSVRNKRREGLRQALGKLNERERHILMSRRLRDVPVTLEELSLQYHVSKERISQIEEKAFEKTQAIVREFAQSAALDLREPEAVRAYKKIKPDSQSFKQALDEIPSCELDDRARFILENYKLSNAVTCDYLREKFNNIAPTYITQLANAAFRKVQKYAYGIEKEAEKAANAARLQRPRLVTSIYDREIANT